MLLFRPSRARRAMGQDFHARFARADPVGLAPEPLEESGDSCRGLVCSGRTCILTEEIRRDLLPLDPLGCARAHPMGVAPEPLDVSETSTEGYHA